MKNNKPWWHPDMGYFGDFYREGENINESQPIEQKTQLETLGLIKLLSLKKGARILDIPCGYGRHSLELAKKKFAVMGIDINPIFLESAIKESSKLSLNNISFFLGNMLELRIYPLFDAIITMFYSFGYFTTEEENFRVLENFYNCLKPGGKLLIQTDIDIKRFQRKRNKDFIQPTLVSGNRIIVEDRYNTSTKRLEGSWTIINNTHKVTRHYSVRLYSQEEYIRMCSEIGFKVNFYSDWDKTPYSNNGSEVLIVAEKLK